jgi:hypothetical protein
LSLYKTNISTLDLAERRYRGKQGVQTVAVFDDQGLLVEGQQVGNSLAFHRRAGGAGSAGMAAVPARGTACREQEQQG